MPTQRSRELFGYEVVEGRQVVVAFEGGEIKPDAGALLLGATDQHSPWMPGRIVLTIVKSIKTTKHKMLIAIRASHLFGDSPAVDLSVAIASSGSCRKGRDDRCQTWPTGRAHQRALRYSVTHSGEALA
jgi:hypothetical protein